MNSFHFDNPEAVAFVVAQGLSVLIATMLLVCQCVDGNRSKHQILSDKVDELDRKLQAFADEAFKRLNHHENDFAEIREDQQTTFRRVKRNEDDIYTLEGDFQDLEDRVRDNEDAFGLFVSDFQDLEDSVRSLKNAAENDTQHANKIVMHVYNTPQTTEAS